MRARRGSLSNIVQYGGLQFLSFFVLFVDFFFCRRWKKVSQVEPSVRMAGGFSSFQISGAADHAVLSTDVYTPRLARKTDTRQGPEMVEN
jgi:hypothetical protein